MPTVELEFDPRPGQYEVLKNLKRFSVLVCHRRWGKTVLCINKLIVAALKCPLERPRFAYISPLYKQSKTVAWDYLKHYTRVIPGVSYNESELRVDLPNGARITLYGADNPDALRGIYLDGVILDENAQMSPKAWTEVLRPALSDRNGWAIFIGTPKGHNAFYDLYRYAQTQPDWYAGMFKASETGVVAQLELKAARETMGVDEYAQEFECSFDAAIKGAVYGKEMTVVQSQKRICPVAYEVDLQVYTAWDLGHNDSTAIIFFQKIGKEIHIIDVEEHFFAKPEFFRTLLAKKGYDYGTFYMPHDVEAKRMEAGGISLREQFEALGIGPIETVKAPKLKEAGLQKVRSHFRRIWIDNQTDRSLHFIECLLQYHYKYDEDRKIYSNEPDHDWTSHYCDALQTLIGGYHEEVQIDLPVYVDYSGGRLTA